MIDIKFLRENPDIVKENIKKKFQDEKLVLVDEVIDLDKKSREATLTGDELRNKRKTLSAEIGNLMRNGKKDEAEKIKAEVQEINNKLEENETLEEFLKKDFKEISKSIEMGDCNEYPVWFDWYENIQVDLEKRPHNYIELDSEWYAYKNNFDVRK